MNCPDPGGCERKHTQWKQWQEKCISSGEILHEELINRLEEGCKIPKSRHAQRREFYRAYSREEVDEAIECGWVIEHDPNRKTLLIKYSSKLGKMRYRPIHVLVSYYSKWKLITMYNPESKSWKWDKNFHERICFCKN